MRGVTPLTHACTAADLTLFHILTQKLQADIHIKQGDYPALILACKAGSLPIVQGLLSLGSPVNEQTALMLNSALHWACSGPAEVALPVAESLLKAGADPCLRNAQNKLPIDLAKPTLKLFQLLVPLLPTATASSDAESLLLRAAEQGVFDVVSYLLDAVPGLNVNCRDGQKCTALHYLCCWESEQAFQLVQRLLSKGADPNAANLSMDTPLHWAASAASWDCGRLVQLLLDAGADAAAAEHMGKTALHYAMEKQQSPLAVALLIVAGASPFTVSKGDSSPLSIFLQRTPRAVAGWKEDGSPIFAAAAAPGSRSRASSAASLGGATMGAGSTRGRAVNVVGAPPPGSEAALELEQWKAVEAVVTRATQAAAYEAMAAAAAAGAAGAGGGGGAAESKEVEATSAPSRGSDSLCCSVLQCKTVETEERAAGSAENWEKSLAAAVQAEHMRCCFKLLNSVLPSKASHCCFLSEMVRLMTLHRRLPILALYMAGRRAPLGGSSDMEEEEEKQQEQEVKGGHSGSKGGEGAAKEGAARPGLGSSGSSSSSASSSQGGAGGAATAGGAGMGRSLLLDTAALSAPTRSTIPLSPLQSNSSVKSSNSSSSIMGSAFSGRASTSCGSGMTVCVTAAGGAAAAATAALSSGSGSEAFVINSAAMPPKARRAVAAAAAGPSAFPLTSLSVSEGAAQAFMPSAATTASSCAAELLASAAPATGLAAAFANRRASSAARKKESGM